MRPVFGDMVTEVQRSIGFFQSLDRKAKITNIVMLGNTVKLPGLSQYMGKHLGYELTEIDAFRRLTGASVVTSPSFKDNLLAFGGAYGLCVQALEKSKLKTNLLPRELLLQRIIKAKKPWAVAGVAAIVLACALNFIFHYMTWEKVHDEHEGANNAKWADAVSQASSINQVSSQLQSEFETRKTWLTQLDGISNEVVGAADRRVMWLEVMKSINKSLPKMALDGKSPPGQIPDHRQLPFVQRRDLKIEYLETQYFPDLAVWFTDTVKRRYIEQNDLHLKAAAVDPAAAANGQPAPPVAPPVENFGAEGGAGMAGAGVSSATDVSSIQIDTPKGPGWVVEIKGYHFYNDPSKPADGGSAHVRKTLLKSIETGTVDLPAGPGGKTDQFTFKELGIGFAILARDIPINRQFRLDNPNYAGNGTTPGASGFEGGPGPGVGAITGVAEDPNNPQVFVVPKCEFVVQFCWQEKPLTKRYEEREAKLRAAATAAANGPLPTVPAAPGANPVVPPVAPAAPVNPPANTTPAPPANVAPMNPIPAAPVPMNPVPMNPVPPVDPAGAAPVPMPNPAPPLPAPPA